MAVLTRAPSLLLAAILLAALAGCGGRSGVREYLDKDTAVTVTAATGGWIFARDRADLAAHARDYITLTPVQSNRAGKRALYLHIQVWSTIDRRDPAGKSDATLKLALLADGRPIALTQSPRNARELGFAAAPAPLETNLAEIRFVPIDADLLRFIAQASHLRIYETDAVSGSRSYDLWRADPAAVELFSKHIVVR